MATGRYSWQALRQLPGRTPLRTKLITAVLALVVMALAAISFASVFMLRGYVTTRHDTDLRNALVRAFNGATFPGAGYAEPFAHGSLVVAIQSAGGQLVWPQGSTFPDYGGPSFNEPLPRLPTATHWASSSGATLITVPAQKGPDSWRVIGTAIQYPSGTGSGTQHEPGTLIVAVPLGDINAMTTRLALFDLVVGGGILVVIALAGAAIVQANLRPLNDIELTAGQIAAGHLNHRVPERDPGTEIGSLGRSLNAMLSQIETAFHAREESERAAHLSEERMRRFIADASHELRTPLTTIRGFAAHYRLRGGSGGRRGTPVTDGRQSSRTDAPVTESVNGSSLKVLAQQGGGLSPAELDHLMGRVEAEATRMGLLVEDLLTLARLDQQRPLLITPVDLLTLAADAVQDARIVSPGRPIELLVAPGAAFLVEGDEARLRQVLANLVNNALTHTPATTPVRVRVAPGILVPPGERPEVPVGPGPADPGPAGSGQGGQPVPAVVLDVEDDGPGMTTEQAERVFERFYRADAARNRASGGTGLGLAIVSGIVAAHGGVVSVSTTPGKGSDFQVRLPLSPDAQPIDEADEGSEGSEASEGLASEAG